MEKDDRIKSAEAKADSTTNAENILEASNDAKPNVVGLPSLSDENLVKLKHKQVLEVLKGLTVAQSRFVLDIVVEDFTANAVVGSNQLTSSF